MFIEIFLIKKKFQHGNNCQSVHLRYLIRIELVLYHFFLIITSGIISQNGMVEKGLFSYVIFVEANKGQVYIFTLLQRGIP